MSIQLKKLDEQNFDDFFMILNQMSIWAYKKEMDPDAKKRLHSHYFATPPKFECLLAYIDHKAVGFISFFDTYATMEARTTMYIEDVFVLDEFREKGIGKAFIDELLEIAKERSHSRIDLLSFGEGPRKFYEKLGAQWKNSNYHYRFSEDLIKQDIN